MWSITKIFRFETAHRISNYIGACRNIHGHSYQLQVSISRNNFNEDDMVMDFKDLKKIVQKNIIAHLDHVLLLKKNPENIAKYSQDNSPILWMEYEPTAERILDWIRLKLLQVLPNYVELKKLTLFETSTGFVEWENDFRNSFEDRQLSKEKWEIK
ncbi:6-carboxytetrahydropterin synthase [Echinicola jeungdonensis]|uniref:6-carboxy-5,6,7,8-tetrahydropterin synthase n=1 Tax=Echinicola jeungdonensis TaxID=709343 RepID=A0ABV5J338_9BACT|nr:6-carboxytetrahydropterin synthase [Echinicola jeungdonensis]MDN3670681.1 6-carboxytetrahydropterin synthase [Echinicola jeungdonensis]